MHSRTSISTPRAFALTDLRTTTTPQFLREHLLEHKSEQYVKGKGSVERVIVEHILQELNVQVMSACVPWMKGIPPTSLMVLVSIQSYTANSWAPMSCFYEHKKSGK